MSRLSEWDQLPDDEQQMRIEQYEREQRTCPDCGNPVEHCSDPKRKNYPFRRICYASMEREAAKAAYQELHKDLKWHDGTFESWSKERSDQFPYPADAGVHIGVSDVDVTPWDRFMTDVDASPHAPADDGDAAVDDLVFEPEPEPDDE
jgi:hypothetical protein